jgi:hypothetical protein
LLTPSLSTLTNPPIFSIICLHMLSPRPVPYLFIPWVSESLLKLWKSFPIFSKLIPAPESFTLISNDIKYSSWVGSYSYSSCCSLSIYCWFYYLIEFLLLSSIFCFDKSLISIQINPFFGVNLKALDKKFSRICVNLPSSP